MPFKLTKTTPANLPWGRSVLFNGTNQYLSVGSAANWTFLHNGSSWTAECWFNVPSASLSSRYTLISTDAASANIGMTLSLNNVSAGDAVFTVYKGVSGQWPVSVATSGNIFTPNTWNHIAAVYNSGTSTGTIYMNGVAVASSGSAVAFSTSAPTYTLAIGRYQFSTPAGYLNGYISNLRITNSVLYTTSFTAPTAPLTAIANTSLLTCNATTIVDSSTNNFTITNNNSATVSSVIPFVAPSYGYKFKNTSNAASVSAGTQRAIFGYGNNSNGSAVSNVSITNLVSNTGIVATDTTGVGTARLALAAAGYGTDKAIFGYGVTTTHVSMTNLVSNTGVVATDTAGVGTTRQYLAAAGYGSDKAIFGYGSAGTSTSITNLVSNTGVVATDTTGVGTARYDLAAAGYGTDKAIFGYGRTSVNVSITNLVSNTGVVASNTTGVGTARQGLAAAGYGIDKALFGYGSSTTYVSMTNKVSNTGVVATDTTGVGTARYNLAAAGYGTDKAIFGYGYTSTVLSMTNLVSNNGVVATDITGVGTARFRLAAAGYSAGTSPAPSGLKFKKVFADAIRYMVATGGDLITTSGSYKIHTFTTVGTSSFVVSSAGSNPSVEYLIVGGGGGGGAGRNSAGGGAGGLIYNTASFSIGTYTTIVGQAGSAAIATNPAMANGGNGGNSIFNALVAFGGGGGGGGAYANNGGSGGGGFLNPTNGIGLQPTSSYGGFGNNGGSGYSAGGGYGSGGGGGAGAVGADGTSSTGGNGGNGKAYAFSGASTYYAGGGGGSVNPGTPGIGGLGGGGAGINTNFGTPVNATGYGSGGGGGLNSNGGAGSPGIILIKYRYTT